MEKIEGGGLEYRAKGIRDVMDCVVGMLCVEGGCAVGWVY
jgi:hypothetical protein